MEEKIKGIIEKIDVLAVDLQTLLREHFQQLRDKEMALDVKEAQQFLLYAKHKLESVLDK